MGGEEHVEGALEFILIDLVTQVLQVETVAISSIVMKITHICLIWAINVLGARPVWRCFGRHFQESLPLG